MGNQVQIPIRTHENFGDSISKLITTLHQISFINDNNISLDFSRTKILNPFFLCGLVSVIKKLESEGKRFTYNFENNTSINSYLQTVHFPSSLTAVTGSLPDFRNYEFKTYIPIINFKTGLDATCTTIRENILSAISEIIKNQLKFSEAQRQPLSYFLDELTNNINDHAHTPEGYLFAQFYPSSNYLDLCICDSGIGIYQSFINNPKFNPSDEIDAMKLALSGYSTKDRPEARGFGISTTRNMLVNGLKGILFIWSGNTSFLQAVNKEAIVNMSKIGSFRGTFIALRLPTIIPREFDFYKFVEI